MLHLDWHKVESLMADKGLGPQEVAKRAGEYSTWVNLILSRARGGQRIQVATVRKLARALGVRWTSDLLVEAIKHPQRVKKVESSENNA